MVENDKDTQAVVQSFFDVFQDRFQSVMKEGHHKKAWENNSKEYSSELEVLRKHLTPLICGAGTGIMLFTTFRVSKFTGKFLGFDSKNRRLVFENLERKRLMKAHHKGLAHERRTKIDETSSILTDLLLSVLAGISATMFLFDAGKAEQDAAMIPLVEGRSLVSDELCSAFILEHEKYEKKIWTGKQADNYPSIGYLNQFVMNCKKRQNVEKYLRSRSQSNLSPHPPIPSPGVRILNEIANREMKIKNSKL